MKYIYIKAILMIGLFLSISSCTDDFEEINSNPNFPLVSEANPGLILPKILFEVGNEMTADLGWNMGNIVAQLVATNNFTGTDRYLLSTKGDTWNLFYRNMRDANNMIALGQDINSGAFEGAGVVLRSFMLANLTDTWGMVPYTEALDGKNSVFTPSYDNQADLYSTILDDLASAPAILNQGGLISGDIMYDGDTDKWIRFANSLQIRYIMRLENKWSELGIDGASMIQNIVDSGMIFTSNDDNAVVSYLSATNRWPLNTARVGSFDEKRMSQTIESVLKGANDPRISILFREVDNIDSNEFIGVPNGLSEDAASNFNGGANNQSRLGQRFREEPAAVEMIYMHFSELMFILAEAAQKGYISGNAEDYYNSGIVANMNYLGLTDTDSFISQPEISLSSGDELTKIATQKWLSLFMVGNEAWYDFRRTGLPALTPGPNALLSELPVRLQYPSDEQVLNESSYNNAIATQGPDEINTKPWLLQ